MENNAGNEGRAETSRAATHRAVEYNEDREQAEKVLTDRYVTIQRRLGELEVAKTKGAKAAAEHNNSALDELALLLNRATLDEIGKLKIEKEEIEQRMRDKSIDPAKYTVQ